MPAENLQELFVNELRDIYDAEKQLTKALPKMAKAAESDELRAAFEGHLDGRVAMSAGSKKSSSCSA